MSDLSAPVVMTDAHVELRPLHPDHLDALISAASDGELWKLWYTMIPEPDGMAAEIDRRLDLQAKGQMAPFTVVSPAEGRIVGMTSYMNIDAVNLRLEIGGTWYARSAQRGPLNTEAKRLLLTRAFDELACIAVELRTHAMNQQSRRAIERLGAKLDGILRQQVPDALKRRKASLVIPTGLGLAPTREALASAVAQLRHCRGRFWPPNPWRERFTAQLARARRK